MLRLCEFYPDICLTTEDIARKNLSQSILYIYQNTHTLQNPRIHTHTHTHTHTRARARARSLSLSLSLSEGICQDDIVWLILYHIGNYSINRIMLMSPGNSNDFSIKFLSRMNFVIKYSSLC